MVILVRKKTTTYTYPKNSIYKNGTVNNDKLTKIISQKYLAQVPWLPLEAWSDHRRLGLPFFENQAVEIDYNVSSNELPLTRANCKECKWEFYQERLRYPANMEINSKDSYMKAVEPLGGADLISTRYGGLNIDLYERGCVKSPCFCVFVPTAIIRVNNAHRKPLPTAVERCL